MKAKMAFNLTHRNIIFDILEPHASQKYGNIGWVFEALCVCICLCYLLGLTSFGAGGQHIEGTL